LKWLPDATARAVYEHLHDPFSSQRANRGPLSRTGPSRTPVPLPVAVRTTDDALGTTDDLEHHTQAAR
jgi:hypothetical protein